MKNCPYCHQRMPDVWAHTCPQGSLDLIPPARVATRRTVPGRIATSRTGRQFLVTEPDRDACPLCGKYHDRCVFAAGSLYCALQRCGNPHHRRAA